MIPRLEHTFIIAAIFSLNIELCICICARAEYEINGECCPKCSPGSHVYRHCTEFTSVTCINCVGSTYTDEPNHLSGCISCTVCDAGRGLKLKMACTQSSDTVCEPLEEYYCTEAYSGKCTYAEKRTKCSPGQYIKQKGTADKDTECALCADGTYSNGSLPICKQHTKCEDLGLTEITPGTRTSDAECGSKSPVALIAGILVTVALVLAVAGAVIFIMYRMKSPLTVLKSVVTTETMSLSEKHKHERNTSPALMSEESAIFPGPHSS